MLKRISFIIEQKEEKPSLVVSKTEETKRKAQQQNIKNKVKQNFL